MPANLNRKQQREIKAVVERAKKDNGIPQTAQQRMATGMEALVGWLFLRQEYNRLVYLISQGLEKLGRMPDPEGDKT